MNKLAMYGGTPVRTGPLPRWPVYGEPEVAACNAALESGQVNYWTGENGRLFEKEFADYIGTSFAVALANGTVALEVALRSLGISSDDEVIVPARTFVGTATPVLACGARPVFADVDAESQNLTAETVAAVLSPKTKAIIAVHLAGWPCEMDEIMAIANQRGIYVIEDCAQAHGAEFRGKKVGSFGHVAAFSFCQDKIISTGGEGGILATNDPDIWEYAWSYKDHGRRYKLSTEQVPGYEYRWIFESPGTNLRMTELQSAIGRKQLEILPDMLEKRRRNASILNEFCSRVPGLRVTVPATHIYHAYYKYYVFIRPGGLKAGWNRAKLLRAMHEEGLPAYMGSCPEIYKEQVFRGFAPGDDTICTTANELGKTSMMLLVHPTMTESDVGDYCAAIEKVFTAACT